LGLSSACSPGNCAPRGNNDHGDAVVPCSWPNPLFCNSSRFTIATYRRKITRRCRERCGSYLLTTEVVMVKPDLDTLLTAPDDPLRLGQTERWIRCRRIREGPRSGLWARVALLMLWGTQGSLRKARSWGANIAAATVLRHFFFVSNRRAFGLRCCFAVVAKVGQTGADAGREVPQPHRQLNFPQSAALTSCSLENDRSRSPGDVGRSRCAGRPERQDDSATELACRGICCTRSALRL
jgi:hypothetical protein